MKKAAVLMLSLILAGGTGGGLYYYFVYQGHNGEVVASSDQMPVYVDSVRTLAGLGSGSGLLQRYAGIVEPQETWSAKIEGDKTVKETFVEVGDTVKKGDKLFSYDTTEDENNLAKNEIEIEHTQNDILSSQKTLEQYEKNEAAATTEDDRLEWETQILQMENSIKQNEYELKERAIDSEKYQSNIDNAIVYSQLDGVIKTVNSSLASGSSSSSSLSDSNSDAYITVMAVGDYRIKATLNEQNVSSVSEGDSMIVYSRVDASQTWSGIISTIDTDNGTSNSSDSYYDTGTSSTNSTNYSFYVKLDTSEGLLLGQHVYIESDVGQTEEREGIWLPEYYFCDAEDGTKWVWAATSRNTLEKRTVELGQYDEEMGTCQVLDGLTEEDYITIDQDGLQEGYVVTKIDYSSDDDADYFNDEYEAEGFLDLSDGDYDDGEIYYEDADDFEEDFDDEDF